MAQSGPGKIRLFTDFTGGEIPVAGTTAAPINWDGNFKVVGDLAETDTGIVSLAKVNGWARISGNNEDGKGAGLATETILAPSNNGTIVVEARVELAALTARTAFIGITDDIADDVAEPVSISSTTLTLSDSDLAGFFFSSEGTDTTHWHMVYNGGSATGETDSTAVVASNDTITAAQTQVLRLEIDPSGTARWYIDGVLRQTVAGAVSTTVLQGALLAAFGTTTTAANIDADYFLVEFNRDWTV